MRQRVFAIFDQKAKAFLPPFTANELGQAARMFADNVNDKNSVFNRHPADFTLFCIGDFILDTGVLVPHTTHELVVNALSVYETDSDRAERLGQGRLQLQHGSKK